MSAAPLSRKLFWSSREHKHLAFWCPGCKRLHIITVDTGPEVLHPKWTWNEDAEHPTFSPSVRHLDGKGGTDCHYFVRSGKIIFLNDCRHELRGRTVDLPDLPEEEVSQWGL